MGFVTAVVLSSSSPFFSPWALSSGARRGDAFNDDQTHFTKPSFLIVTELGPK